MVAYFSQAGVAAIELKQGTLCVGDVVWVKGHTTDLKQTVESMQLEHQLITEATCGQQITIQVHQRVRRHDRIYKL